MIRRSPDAFTADPRDQLATDALSRERLRLRPSAIAALRRLTTPRTVGGHVLPAGVTVMLPIPLLHRDHDQYAAPTCSARAAG